MMRLRFARFPLLCLVGLALGAGPGAVPCKATDPKEGLRETRKKIGAEKKVLEDLKLRGRDLLKSLEAVDKEIVVAESRRRASADRLAGLEKEKKGMRRELNVLENKIKEQRNDQGHRLVAYYRLGKTGMLPVLFSDAPPPEKFRNLDSLKRVLVADWQRLETYHGLLKEKEAVEAALEERLKAESSLLETLRKRKKVLKVRREEKNALLFRIDQDKDLHERLLRELREAERELLERIREQPPTPVIVEGGPLRAQKGKLHWPVKGRIHRTFGISHSVRSKGIDIKAKPGAMVRAVWGGGVAYADWFRGYGKLLIIHHGEQDYTVVAHLSELTKKKGERVEAGEIVGRAGETGSVDGCLVHFEIWHRGTPEDPLRWLRRNGGRN